MTDAKKPWEEQYGGKTEGGGAEPWKQDFGPDAASAPVASRGFKGWAQDIAATAVKGAIGVPEALVGLADIPTGGAVGKFLENEGGAVGFRPKEAKAQVNDWHSDATKEAQRKFQAADGVVDKTITAIQNPSLIATAVGESLPSMGLGGVASRGLMAATKLGQMGAKGAVIAGAAGEGVVGAGSQAEQIRQETQDGLLTPGQTAAALATGVATAGFGYAGGKVAQRLGIGDAETMLAQGIRGVDKQLADTAARAAANPAVADAAVKSIPRKVIEGAIAEGFLEELPQSMAEQIFQNVALGKDWHNELDSAAVMGVLSGGAMGAGAAGFHGLRSPAAAPAGDAVPGTPMPAADATAQPSAGLSRVSNEFAARLQALQEQEQGEPQVPQVAQPDGAAALAQQQAQAQAVRDAEMAASRAVESPDDEILQSTGATAPRPSEVMGLRSGPEAGALENAAALSVDSGATAQLQQAAAQAQAAEEAAKAKPATQKQEQPAQAQQAVDSETGEIAGAPSTANWSDADLSMAFRNAQSKDVRLQLAAELSRRRAARDESDLQAELRAEQEAADMPDAPDSTLARVQEDAGDVPARIDIQGAAPAAQAVAPGANAKGANVATLAQLNRKKLEAMSADELQQLSGLLPAGHARQEKIQKAIQDRAQQAQAAITTGAESDGNQADQAQQGGAQQPQASAQEGIGRAGAPSAGLPAAAPAGRGDLQTVGLTDGGTTTANAGAQAAPAASAAAEAPFTTVTTAKGTYSVSTADLNGDAPSLATYTAEGKKRAAKVKRADLEPMQATPYEALSPEQKSAFDARQGIAPGQREAVAAKQAAEAQPIGDPAAPKLVAMKTVYGDTVMVSQGDLDSPRKTIPTYTKSGKRKVGGLVHRENLDPTGEKSAANAAENAKSPLFATVTNKDGGTFASKAAAQRGLNSLGFHETHEVVPAGSGFVGRKKAADEKPDAADSESASVPDRMKRAKAEKEAAETPAGEKTKPKSVPAKVKKAQAERADYFTPGNVVKSYGGHDRVIAYEPTTERGGWSVTVRAVRKEGNSWVNEPNERERAHSTQPDARDLKAGPLERAEPPKAAPDTLDQTETDAFKRWFAGSRVVDADGKPLVVYHGTGRDFSIFDAAAQSSHIPLPGFYFSPDPDIASGFAESAAKLDENRAGRAFRPIGANVVPAYLSLQNPAEIDASKTAHGGRMPSESVIEKLLIGARKAGHDGAIIRGWSDGSGPVQYVAFRPEQIKSATGNNGNFDPDDADITHFGSTKDGTEAMSPAVANAMRALSQPRPVDSAVLGMVREGRPARDILSLVAGKSKSRFNRQVARLLLKTGANPTTHLDNANMGGEQGFKFLAEYSRASNSITMTDGALRQGEQIFLHEMIHAATLKALDRKGLQSLQMRRLYEHVKKQGGADLLSQYGMKNVGEFVAEAFTNPQFQRALRQMDAPSGGTIKSAWDGFVRILRSILGLPQDGHDALSQALEIGVNVMREDKALRERGVRSRLAGDAYAQSSSTQASFESRIDALFNGGKATTGTRVLDRSDVMALLGYPDVPLMLNERHLLDGLTNHPEMTSAAWKKVPGWLENPSMVYRDPRDSGRLVVIAPDTLAGYPVMLVVEPKPNPAGSRPAPAVPTESLLVTVYAKTSGNLPAPGFLASSGNLLYVNTKNAPEIARRGGVQFPKQAALLQGRQKILTEKNLAGWRKANAREGDDAHFGATDPASPSAMQSTRAKLGERLNDAFSAPGTLSKWHTTVGSMYNLAEQQPAFKPVFESAKAYIDDISQYAMDAADQAPTIIPRLEDMKDAIPFASKKKPVSAADNKAIAAPIFEGTLNWARDLSGKPVPLETLEKEAATMTAEQKAQRLLRAGEIDAGMLKGWQGMPVESYEKAVNTRYESRILKPGVAWTDAELTSQWGLNERQVALYREYRAAVDRSIDTTTRADILRFGGKQLESLRGMVMDAANMDDALQLVESAARAEMAADPDSAQAWGDVMQGAVERVERARELQKRGYAPLQRFGEYTVDVVTDGERKFFSLYETKAEANAAAKVMREEYGATNVAQGTLSKEEHKMLAGVTPESLELFGNMLGLASEGDAAQDKVFQEFLRRTKSNNSALKRLIHRKGIAGFSEDVGRGLASFIYSNARLTSGGLNVGSLTEAAAAIPKGQGQLRDAAERLRQHVLEPQEAGASVRGFMFAQYLGGSVASALVNLTQPMATTLPYLSQFGGASKAAQALLKASKDMATRGLQYEKDLADALKRAEDSGTVSPQEIHYLMGQARGQSVLRAGGDTKASVAQAMASNAWARTKLGWGLMFGAAEQVNRRMTFIAAYRLAKAQGMDNPEAFATKAVDETQFVQNKANKMEWGRSTAGGTLMTFKGYSIAYLELMHRMWTQGGPEGKRAVLLAAGTLMLLGGAGGLPFMEDAEDIATGMGRMLGYNWNAKKARQDFLADVFGRQFAQFADKGLSGLPGAPIDVSGRLGMGNLIPGTGLLLDKTNNSRDYMELLGPAGDFVSRVVDGGKQVLGGAVSGDAGKVARGALNVAPTAVRNLAKGADMAQSGQYKDTRGNKVMDVTAAEAMAKAIGFQPNSVADAQEANALRQDAKNFYALKRSQITAMWAGGVSEKDAAKVQQARDAIADWNRKNPDQPMLVRIPDVMRRVKEMNKTKEQRILDSAPKAMKAQIREDIARAAMLG